MRPRQPAGTTGSELQQRVRDRLRAWNVEADRRVETDSSVLVFGNRAGRPVVLKVARRQGGEFSAGPVLQAFGGHGFVRVLEHIEGAALLEQLRPGSPLADRTLAGDDERATAILASVIGRMSPSRAPMDTPTVEAWGRAFDRCLERGEGPIPRSLLDAARGVYDHLCATQSSPRLLHGDLHHHNVLLDAERGWMATDPKGVVGELEYEVGAAMRNPCGQPELFTSPVTILRRAGQFETILRMDAARVLAWAFSQAVLAAVWDLEDGNTPGRNDPWLVLAQNIRPLLEGEMGA